MPSTATAKPQATELVGLRWPDVDLDAGRLAVRLTRVRAGNRVVTNPPKTRAGRRVVELDPATVAALRT